MKQTYLICILFISLFSSAQIINFPDANFKAKLLQSSTSNSIAKNLQGNNFKIDANNDTEIQFSEALQVSDLNVFGSNITSVVGVENFTNLLALRCGGNLITTLNLPGMTNLTFLDCTADRLTSLNVSALTGLRTLWCGDNMMTSLNLGGLPNLDTVYCDGNRLNSLNLSGLVNLRTLECYSNYLTYLNASPAINLETLYCNQNRLTSINVTGLTELTTFHCYTNFLTTIDVTTLTKLQSFWCYTNRLTSLFMKNGKNESLIFYDNLNLNYICVDDSQLVEVQQLLASQSYLNMHSEINTYCSFTPGGTFYTIQGNTKYDATANGCDVNDINYPRLKFSISNGTTNGNLISDSSGNYFLPLEAGTYTITPILDNPTYYNISPSSVNVTFPTQASPLNQNFCVTRNGVHNDLEIMMCHTSPARPGFDATYRIYYKNNGFNTQSGTINLAFNDAVLDLVSSNPAAAVSLNNLSWTFSNLLPLESRVITLNLNLNSPIETPALNSGSILNYTTSIASSLTDETPNNNTFRLNQTVVNSYDPNDKTCLQGTYVGPDKIGNYVHYMIRFENTGTFPAENIVVKDMIDTAKFDVSSLIPLHASHSYFTKITENKVEFIFKNINLPYDDANNDGFVAFKIKTLPSLVVGNTFSNSANIYFDYNFPIITNTATTNIVALNNPSFEFANYFSLYPNPTTNELNINLKSAIEINSIQIYNTIGQLVTVQIGNALKVDVSNLKTGNYFIKINTDEGFSSSQFIKE